MRILFLNIAIFILLGGCVQQPKDSSSTSVSEVKYDESQLGQFLFDTSEIYDLGEYPINTVLTFQVNISNTGKLTTRKIELDKRYSTLNEVPIEEEDYHFKFTGSEATYPGKNGNCDSTISSNGSCVLDFTFFSEDKGVIEEKFYFNYHNGKELLKKTLTLKIYAADPAEIVVDSTQAVFDYGTLDISEATTKEIFFKNIGELTATNLIGSIRTSGGYEDVFTFLGGSFPGTGGTCINTLASGDRCKVVLELNPEPSKYVSANITLSYSNPILGASAIAIGKVKGFDNRAYLQPTLSQSVFDSVYNTSTNSTFVVTFNNIGYLSATNVQFSDEGTFGVELDSTDCPNAVQTLPVGGICTATFRIKPDLGSSTNFSVYEEKYPLTISYEDSKGVSTDTEIGPFIRILGEGRLDLFADNGDKIANDSYIWKRSQWNTAINGPGVTHELSIVNGNKNGIGDLQNFSVSITPNDGLFTTVSVPGVIPGKKTGTIVLKRTPNNSTPYDLTDKTYTVKISYFNQVEIKERTITIVAGDALIPIVTFRKDTDLGEIIPTNDEQIIDGGYAYNGHPVSFSKIFGRNDGASPVQISYSKVSGSDSLFSFTGSNCQLGSSQILGSSCEVTPSFTISSEPVSGSGDNYQYKILMKDDIVGADHLDAEITLDITHVSSGMMTGSLADINFVDIPTSNAANVSSSTRILSKSGYGEIKHLTCEIQGISGDPDSDPTKFSCSFSNKSFTTGDPYDFQTDVYQNLVAHFSADSVSRTSKAKLIVKWHGRNQDLSDPYDSDEQVEYLLNANTIATPVIKLSATSYFVNNLMVGTPTSKSFTITNSGLAQADVNLSPATPIEITGIDTGTGCSLIDLSAKSFRMDAESTCTISYQVTPELAKVDRTETTGFDGYSKKITIYYRKVGTATNKSITHTFTANTIPAISITSSLTLDLTGAVIGGAEKTATITYRNNSLTDTANLVGNGTNYVEAEIKGLADYSEFSLALIPASNCTLLNNFGHIIQFHIKSMSDCQIEVTFNPSSSLLKSGTIDSFHAGDKINQISFNAQAKEILTISADSSQIEFPMESESPIDLGSGPATTTIEKVFTLSNTDTRASNTIGDGSPVGLSVSDSARYAISFAPGASSCSPVSQTATTIIDDNTGLALKDSHGNPTFSQMTFNISGNSSCQIIMTFYVPDFGTFKSNFNLTYLGRTDIIYLSARGKKFARFDYSLKASAGLSYIDLDSVLLDDTKRVTISVSNVEEDSVPGKFTEIPSLVNYLTSDCAQISIGSLANKWKSNDVVYPHRNGITSGDEDYVIENNTCTTATVLDYDLGNTCSFDVVFTSQLLENISGACITMQHNRYETGAKQDTDSTKYIRPDDQVTFLAFSKPPDVYFGGWSTIQAFGDNHLSSAKVSLKWGATTIQGNKGTVTEYNVFRRPYGDTTPYDTDSPINDSPLSPATLTYDDESIQHSYAYEYMVLATIEFTGNTFNPLKTRPIETDYKIRVIVPPPNMALVHKFMANKAMCENLYSQTIDRSADYSCSAYHTVNDLVVDMYEYNGDDNSFGYSPKLYDNAPAANSVCTSRLSNVQGIGALSLSLLTRSEYLTAASGTTLSGCITAGSNYATSGRTNECKSTFGIEDLVGNAWEYTTSSIVINPTTPTITNPYFGPVTPLDFEDENFQIEKPSYVLQLKRIGDELSSDCFNPSNGVFKSATSGVNCPSGYVYYSKILPELNMASGIYHLSIARHLKGVGDDIGTNTRYAMVGGSADSYARYKLAPSRWTVHYSDEGSEALSLSALSGNIGSGREGGAARCKAAIP